MTYLRTAVSCIRGFRFTYRAPECEFGRTRTPEICHVQVNIFILFSFFGTIEVIPIHNHFKFELKYIIVCTLMKKLGVPVQPV